MDTSEKRFESDIESYLISPAGGYKQGKPCSYIPSKGLYFDALISFVKASQPKEWARLEKMSRSDPEQKFYLAFQDAVTANGMISVLRHGFKHRGIDFKVCYFEPESGLNRTSRQLYEMNDCRCIRQWQYSDDNTKSVDMVIAMNGIPVCALELKNQFKGQNVDNSKRQWMYDRDPREVCFKFNSRILAFFCIDLTEAWMATRLAAEKTFFLPFNQGSNGAGNDGGKGNPPDPDGYVTSYIWENVLQKDKLLDIIRKFINLEVRKEKKILDDGTETERTKQTLIFPRYHQLDVVRKLIQDVKDHGAGTNYLVQHSAGSGKSNSIAWTAYRLASLHDDSDKPVFASVIVVTDRTVLDAQLQATISGIDHTIGSVETIDDKKNSKDLRDAINDGRRIIVTTLQKFPVIYDQVDDTSGRKYAVIVDEAHSSQTGKAAIKLKTALADTEEALREYAELEGREEAEIDKTDPLIQEMIVHGRHRNLSFFAFTATPKPQTLEMFGTEQKDGSFKPFHIYSMRQAIEEGFILDVLQNYMTYNTCYKIAKTIPDNPDVPSSRAAKVIRKFEELHPYNIEQKAEIIVETFRSTTKQKIGGRGKMMVVTSSRLATVRYFHAIKRYIAQKHYDDVEILAAFSGSVKDGTTEWTEPGLNVRSDGSHISEDQTKEEFHDTFNVLIVAEKYQTGFDEPLLHTMIVDKKLRGLKAVQTLSRLNRICEGKNDTFVLDFINSREDIRDAFQPYYQETDLTREMDVDQIYKIQKEIRAYKVYTDEDVEAFSKIYFSKSGQDSKTIGRMSSALTPVVVVYNKLDENERYLFRRKLRLFVKWYNYISQICRMYDSQLHKEYTFCAYFEKLLPPEATAMVDLAGKLQLEYYKLTKTFEGTIDLKPQKSDISSGSGEKGNGTDKKAPLEEIIDKINEEYKGDFGPGDKVVLNALKAKLEKDEKLRTAACNSDIKIFEDSIFPKIFAQTAQKNYEESSDAYTKLFADKARYDAVMHVLGDLLYRELRSDCRVRYETHTPERAVADKDPKYK